MTGPLSAQYNCPDACVCRACPCAGDDDVCFPGERLRAEREALYKAGRVLISAYIAGDDIGPAIARLEDLTGGQQSGV